MSDNHGESDDGAPTINDSFAADIVWTSSAPEFSEVFVPDEDDQQLVSEDTVAAAQAVWSSLGRVSPRPDVYATENGWVAFNWRSAKDAVFAVHVKANEKIAFSGRYKGSTIYGAEASDSFVASLAALVVKRVHGNF